MSLWTSVSQRASAIDAPPARIVLAVTVAAVLLYGLRLNHLMGRAVPEAETHAAQALTPEYIREVYKKVTEDGGIRRVHRLPPKLRRRYVVVGGSGLLGGQIVLDLLAIGTPPEAIRIVDVRGPSPRSGTAGPGAAKIAFAQADIVSETQTQRAFAEPWPPAVSDLPLTVFHTAGAIRPFERAVTLYHRSSRVNVGGTANVLAAARAAGAGVFVSTSSSCVGQQDVDLLRPPSRVQVLDGRDFFRPPKPTDDFPSNYARSKAEAERLVCAADEPQGMRTGAIRPGNAIYGRRHDLVVWPCLQARWAPTHGAAYIQNWIHAGNASLSHLQYEAALLGPHADKVAGRPYLVTDKGPPIRFGDCYAILSTAAETGFKVYHPPPLLLLLAAYAVEALSLLVAGSPALQRVFREPGHPLNVLQPGVLITGGNVILDDSEARRPPEQGGIGYEATCTTVEGICAQVADWNEWVKQEAQAGRVE